MLENFVLYVTHTDLVSASNTSHSH